MSRYPSQAVYTVFIKGRTWSETILR